MDTFESDVAEILKGFAAIEQSNQHMLRLVGERFDILTDWLKQLEARVDSLAVIASRS